MGGEFHFFLAHPVQGVPANGPNEGVTQNLKILKLTKPPVAVEGDHMDFGRKIDLKAAGKIENAVKNDTKLLI